MTSPPLRQLDKYQLTDVLGQGAMGVVYRAFDPVLNRYLAIKVMSAVIASDEQLRDRFLREAQAAGSLQHPNVVTVYDFGEADEHLFIAMEYVEGVDLAEVIDRRDVLAVPVKLDIMIDALNGLAYAHSHGLVHRDIKPANIRIGEDHRAKLMDFGIARIEKSSMTQTGALLGTPQYMAPEQVTGGEISAAADIFAAGAVLYEFLTYAKAFFGDSLHVILYKIVSDEPAPLRKLAPELPASLEPVIAKALAKDPAQRYRSALDMAKDLTRVRDEITGTAQRSTVAVRVSSRTLALPHRAGARPKRRVIMASSVVVVVAAAVFGVWRFLPSPASGAGAQAANAVDAPQATPRSVPQPGPSAVTPGSSAGGVAVSTSAPPPRSAAPGARQPNAAVRGAPTQDSMVRAVRANILSSRRLAQDAGAVVADLAAGDSLLSAADALIARGRPADAVQQLSLASVRWVDAERRARERAASARVAAVPERVAPASSPASPPATPPATPLTGQPAGTQPSPAVERSSAAPSVSAPAAATDARPEIERVIAAYARAIESGNVSEIRRAYPGITSAQQQQWEGFFRSVRNFKAHLALDQLQMSGTGADARISATYAYESRGTGQADRQNIVLQASLTRDASGWRLVTIR